MNNEQNMYSKAIGIIRSQTSPGWVVTLTERMSGELKVRGIETLSDVGKIPSAIERLAGHKEQEDNPVLVAVGADTAQTVFFPFTAPLVDGPRLEGLISAQAETLLPMPLNQAAFTWRFVGQDGTVRNGVLAAVRRGYFQELANIAPGRVGSILPDAAALVKGWSALFESTPDQCVLIQVRRNNCIIAVSEQEKLVRAAALDVEDASLTGTFVHDLDHMLDVLNIARPMMVYVSGDEASVATLCRDLVLLGRKASRMTLSQNKVSAMAIGDKLADVIHNPEIIGLPILALAEDCPEYDFIRRPRTQDVEAAVLDTKSMLRGLILAAVAALLLWGAVVWTSGRELKAIQQALAADYNGLSGQKILTRHQMREQISKARPDLLEVLSAIGSCMESDMLLDSISYKKGQPVRISAKARSFDQANLFQKKLQEKPFFTNVNIISPTRDERRNQVQFTITLSYRNFSK